MNDRDSCLWDSSIISRGVGSAKAAANDLCRRELLIQKAAEWGVNNEDGTVLKTDLWNEAIGCDDFIEAILKSNGFCCGLDFSQKKAKKAWRNKAKLRTEATFLTAGLLLNFLPWLITRILWERTGFNYYMIWTLPCVACGLAVVCSNLPPRFEGWEVDHDRRGDLQHRLVHLVLSSSPYAIMFVWNVALPARMIIQQD